MIHPALVAATKAGTGNALPVQRCVNLSNGLEAPVEGAWGYVIEDEHLRHISQSGFDTVRLPVKISAHLAPDGPIAPALLGRLDHIIRISLDAGLQVILDLHHFDEIMQDPARHAQTPVSIWVQLGKHYEGQPDNLMFELLNEPEGALTTEAASFAIYDAEKSQWIEPLCDALFD